MARFLYRVGRLCAEHPLYALLAWVVLVIALLGLKSQFGGVTSNDLSLPGSQSQQATDLLAAKFPPQQNGSSPIVFHVRTGKITDAANKDAVESSYKALLKAPDVYSATDPFGKSSSALVSKDGHTAWTPVLLKITNGQVTEARTSPVTLVPGGGPLPSAAGCSTTPATSQPAADPSGFPGRSRTSPRFSDEATTRTRTWPGSGTGSATSASATCGAAPIVLSASTT